MPIDASRLTQRGDYLFVANHDDFHDVLVLRVALGQTTRLPAGSFVPVSSDDALVAFSSRCTHMGCHVLPALARGDVGRVPDPSGVLLRCPCHSSCFDLAARGLVVVGPATDALAQVGLRAEADAGLVELVDWIATESVPYGAPFCDEENRQS